MLKAVSKVIIVVLLLIACFFGFIYVRDRWREDHIQANKGSITIGMPEAEVIAILGEPTSKAMIDTPGLYWCYGSDTWEQWELGDVYCGSTALQMSLDGHVVELPH
ncbi:MAG: hypothetical protein QM785_16050 [Pyrinomonadaceae bacterium]